MSVLLGPKDMSIKKFPIPPSEQRSKKADPVRTDNTLIPMGELQAFLLKCRNPARILLEYDPEATEISAAINKAAIQGYIGIEPRKILSIAAAWANIPDA